MKKCLNIKKKKKRKLGSCFGSNEPLVICIFVFIMALNLAEKVYIKESDIKKPRSCSRQTH